jgi:hypothetical protein
METKDKRGGRKTLLIGVGKHINSPGEKVHFNDGRTNSTLLMEGQESTGNEKISNIQSAYYGSNLISHRK